MPVQSKRKKILIIEDEKILSTMYQASFEREGFDVAAAATVQEAIGAAKAEKPDFILLDILLSGGNGLDFLRQKNETPEISSTPVLVFSAYDHAETKKQALLLGARDYFLKTDHTPQEVVEKVKEYLA